MSSLIVNWLLQLVECLHLHWHFDTQRALKRLNEKHDKKQSVSKKKKLETPPPDNDTSKLKSENNLCARAPMKKDDFDYRPNINFPDESNCNNHSNIGNFLLEITGERIPGPGKKWQSAF